MSSYNSQVQSEPSTFQAFSAVGRKKLVVHVVILLVNIIVLAVSARINVWQEFYFMADLFPFALSVFTASLLALMIILDVSLKNSFTGWPQFEIGSFAFLSLIWLVFNSFSTNRWRNVPLSCSAVPEGDWRSWCVQVNVLRALVWVELIIFVCTWITTLRYTTTQSARGNEHIYKMPLSRYQPIVWSEHKEPERRRTMMQQHQRGDSEFFQNGIRGSSLDPSFQRIR